jgi:hypothetical protein
MKRVAAEICGQAGWATVQPPLVKMHEAVAPKVLAE